jgi:hypothetical protein
MAALPFFRFDPGFPDWVVDRIHFSNPGRLKREFG